MHNLDDYFEGKKNIFGGQQDLCDRCQICPKTFRTATGRKIVSDLRTILSGFVYEVLRMLCCMKLKMCYVVEIISFI